MTAAVFPVLGAAFIFGVILPAAAFAAKAGFWILGRNASTTGLHGSGGALRYALLVCPTAIPLAWFISACLHQAESTTASQVCVLFDPPGALCPEIPLLAAAIILLMAIAAVPRLIRDQRTLCSSSTPEALAGRSRIENIVHRHEDLAAVMQRIVVTDSSPDPIATLGILSPRVVIHTSFAQLLDDGALLAALRHEAQHVRARDPFRYFVAWWALATNPIARWLLGAEFSRWIVVRETHCDRRAVLAGASAPALAQALVTAARFAPSTTVCNPSAFLGTSNERVLRLRVSLLLAYAERRPDHCCSAASLPVAAWALVFAFVLPHFGGGALDALHRNTEAAASLVTRR